MERSLPSTSDLLLRLAAGGEAGVTQLLTLLREELEVALQACGCPSVRQVPRELVIRTDRPA